MTATDSAAIIGALAAPAGDSIPIRPLEQVVRLLHNRRKGLRLLLTGVAVNLFLIHVDGHATNPVSEAWIFPRI